MHLVLVRGLPGSGKTTLAKYLASKLGLAHVEADRYFEQDGTYKFNGSKLKEAHDDCYDRAKSYLCKHKGVIISNTFVTRKEMAPYFKLAEEFGMRAKVIECKEDYGSVHDVPAHVIEKMKARWEN